MSDQSTTSGQLRARGLSGWYVMMLVFPDGKPIPGRKAHTPSCRILNEDWTAESDYLAGTEFAPVAVEEVPQDTQPCLICVPTVLRRWQAGARPTKI